MLEAILSFIFLVLASFGQVTVEEIERTTEPPPAAETVGTTTGLVVAVIDGDTIDVLLETGVTERVRYIGIDTPEMGDGTSPECFAAEAKERNAELVAGRSVTLVPDVRDRDDYNRLLRYVYVDDTFVNAQLLFEGYAALMTIPPDTTQAAYLRSRQQSAAAAKNGWYAVCQSAS
jgi:micrococcal nuclease